MGSAERVPGREHIPSYPRGFTFLRWLQLIVTVITLGVTAYTVTFFAFVGNSLMIFTCVASLIVTIWLVSAHSCAPRAYNYWATLVLDIFLFLFWLVSFILTAIGAAWLFVNDSGYCSYYTCYTNSLSSDEVAFASVLAAAAGLGAINCILFLVSLIIHSVVVCRHRAKGMHSKVSRGRVGNEAFPMAPQPHANYAAVPQQGMPFNQHQDTAYNPNQMYNPPPAAAAAYSPHQQHQHQHQHQQQHQQQHTGGFYPSPQSFYAPPPSHSPQPVSELPYEKNVSPAPLHAVYEVPGSTASPYQPPAYQPPNQI